MKPNHYARVHILSACDHWNHTDVEHNKPFVPTQSYTRPEWATNILRELGAKVEYLVLVGFDQHTMNEDVIDEVIKRGLEVDGQVYRLAFITQRKGLNAPLPMVDEATAKRIEEMFPRVLDVVRGGALLTPMRGGVATHVPARVLITTPDDARFQLGDGQGCVSAEWVPGILRPASRQKMQFRAVIHELNSGVDMLAKGTLLRVPDAEMHGYDIVLTKNEVKGGLNGAPLGEFDLKVTLGVMQGESEELSGWTTFGRQYAQFLPREFYEHPDTDRYVRRIAKMIHRLKDQPTKLAKLVISREPLRDETGDVDRQKVLAFAAALSEALGNNQLMFSKLIRELLSDALADKCRNLAVSGGMNARYYMFTCDDRLADGQIVVSNRAFHKHHHGESKVVTGRNPHVDERGAVAVTLSGSADVHDGYAVANGKTMIDSAADFDGDSIVVGVGTSPQMQIWRDIVAQFPRDRTEKIRQKGEPPATKAAMIAQVMKINIGAIERTLAKFVAARHIHGDALQGYMNKRLVSINIPQVLEFLGMEMQKAVDAVKNSSIPNMEAVRDLSLFVDQFIDDKDVGYIPLDNGMLPMFRVAKKPVGKYEVKTGEYVLPSNFVSDRTPLGAHMRKVEDLVPWVELDTIDNSAFIGWINLIPGEGAQAALKSYEQYVGMMRALFAVPNGTLSSDMVEADKASIIRAFKEEWREHYATKDEAWLRSAASQFWACWATSTNQGYTLWHGLPEVWGKMLLENKERIARIKPVLSSRLIGRDFKKHLTSGEVWSNATVYTKGDVLRIRIAELGADNMLAKDVPIPVGKYRVQVKDTSKEGSFTIMFFPEGYEKPVTWQPSTTPAVAAETPVAFFEPAIESGEDQDILALAAFDEEDYIDPIGDAE